MELKEWFAGSGRPLTLKMTIDDAESAAHQGQCDADVKALSERQDIAAQLAAMDKDVLAAELKEYGAWDEKELADHDQNLQRILWLAASDILDELNS